MANLLKITKLDNDYFSFILNNDVVNEVVNLRNDLTIVANKCHFKTANGANIIKEQDITFGNITLVNGVATIVPTSNDNLIDELTALGFFDWIVSTGGGVDRFTDLLDGFSFTNQGGKIVRVNVAETQLEATQFSVVSKSTDLTDMPVSITPNKLIIGKADGTKYEAIDPLALPISTATLNAINGISIVPLIAVDYPELTADNVQTFEVPTGRVAKLAYINDGVQHLETVNNALRGNTFTQSGDFVTFAQATKIGNSVTIYIQ